MSYKEPFQREKLVEVEITNRNTEMLALPQILGLHVKHPLYGQMSRPGTARFKIYESSLDDLKKLVETEPVLVAEAEKKYAKKLGNAVVKLLIEKRLVPEDTKLADIDIKDFKYRDVYEEARQTCGFSVESIFCEENERDLRPLSSLTVIQAGIVLDDPDTLADYRHTEGIDAQTIANAMMLYDEMRARKAQQQQSQQQPHQNNQGQRK